MGIHHTLRLALPGVFLLCTALHSQPAERPKAEAMVKEGIAFLKAHGKDSFIAEVQQGTGRFHLKQGSTLYLMVYDPKGITLAHGMTPAAVGTNRWGVKDPDGKMIVQEIIQAGLRKGGGWVDYKWPNPTNGKVEDKTTFCLAENGIVVGCGIYK
jgi:signal transduction histidine kinase